MLSTPKEFRVRKSSSCVPRKKSPSRPRLFRRVVLPQTSTRARLLLKVCGLDEKAGLNGINAASVESMMPDEHEPRAEKVPYDRSKALELLRKTSRR